MLGSVLIWRRYPKRLGRFPGMVKACRAYIDPNDFEVCAIDNGRDGKWECVMVRVNVCRVIWITHVEKALIHSAVIIDTVRS